jgi:hypothetical protein
MKALTLSISEQTKFSSSEIADDVCILTIKWADNVLEHEKFWLCHKMSSLLYTILVSKKHLQKIDLSNFDGIEQFNSACNSIVEINFPDTVTSVYIEKAESLRKLYAKGAKSISIAKAPCLESIEYGNGLEKLSLSDTGIRNISVGKNIRLRSGAFKNCKNLIYAKLEAGVDIEPGTFENCSNLREVILPDDLLVIEPNLFKNCTKLRNISGGKKVKQIFPSAFEGCEELEHIDCTSFYKFTNLEISEREWNKDIRPFNSYSFSIESIRNKIRKFADNLKEIKIESPEDYIAENFFHSAGREIGVLINYQSSIRRWIVWSLTEKKFYVTTKNYSPSFKEGDVFLFEYDNRPIISIDNQINIQASPLYHIDLSNVTKINEDNASDLGCDPIVLEYFHPTKSLTQRYEEIVNLVDNLDITAIIDSYTIKVETWWQTYPGRDDSEFYERKAKSDYTDAYLENYLPQEDRKEYSNGCRPWDYDHEKENKEAQASADSEAKSLRDIAHKNYSKNEHICTLIQEFINERKKLEAYIEMKYHFMAVKRYLHYRGANASEDVSYTTNLYKVKLEELLLDNKYNGSIEKFKFPPEFVQI